MARQATIGSVSHGTMRSEHLLPRFLDVLEELDSAAAEDFRASWTEEELEDEELADMAVEELFDIIEQYAPPFCYFGAHAGDGSDFGFWISEELFDDPESEDVLRVPAGDPWPEDASEYSYVLEVTDHGNATLYSSTGDREPIWSIV